MKGSLCERTICVRAKNVLETNTDYSYKQIKTTSHTLPWPQTKVVPCAFKTKYKKAYPRKQPGITREMMMMNTYNWFWKQRGWTRRCSDVCTRPERDIAFASSHRTSPSSPENRKIVH